MQTCNRLVTVPGWYSRQNGSNALCLRLDFSSLDTYRGLAAASALVGAPSVHHSPSSRLRSVPSSITNWRAATTLMKV